MPLSDEDARRVRALRRTAIAAGVVVVALLGLSGGQELPLLAEGASLTRLQLADGPAQLAALLDCAPCGEAARRALIVRFAVAPTLALALGAGGLAIAIARGTDARKMGLLLLAAAALGGLAAALRNQLLLPLVTDPSAARPGTVRMIRLLTIAAAGLHAVPLSALLGRVAGRLLRGKGAA